LNLVQAVGGGQESSAFRVVGTQRIVVEPGVQTLRVLVQCRFGRRWMIPEIDGGIRYLNGVLKEMDGSWIVACGNLEALDRVAHCLPVAYQHLLTPNSDDWHTLKIRHPGDRSPGTR
jgi:hypothetical protein